MSEQWFCERHGALSPYDVVHQSWRERGDECKSVRCEKCNREVSPWIPEPYKEMQQRINTLEALLKARDGARHDPDCRVGNPYATVMDCTCGHDAVAKYFAEHGK